MDKKLFVIAIATGTVVITTLLQVFMQGRDIDPRTKRLLWITLAAGVVALVVAGTLVVGR